MSPAERPASKSKNFLLRVGLSFFIVFHLTVIAVLANDSSFLARSLDRWITPYGNQLGLNVTWNFFAPDPAHTMFIHYFVNFEDDAGKLLQEPVEGFIPPEKEKIVIHSSERRFLYATRFLILDERRIQNLLGPFLCREHPGATSVHIENVIEPIPNLDLSQLGEMKERSEAVMMEKTIHCGEPLDEVQL